VNVLGATSLCSEYTRRDDDFPLPFGATTRRRGEISSLRGGEDGELSRENWGGPPVGGVSFYGNHTKAMKSFSYVKEGRGFIYKKEEAGHQKRAFSKIEGRERAPYQTFKKKKKHGRLSHGLSEGCLARKKKKEPHTLLMWAVGEGPSKKWDEARFFQK